MTNVSAVQTLQAALKTAPQKDGGAGQTDGFGQMMDKAMSTETVQKDKPASDKTGDGKQEETGAADKKDNELKPGEAIPLAELGWVPEEVVIPEMISMDNIVKGETATVPLPVIETQTGVQTQLPQAANQAAGTKDQSGITDATAAVVQTDPQTTETAVSQNLGAVRQNTAGNQKTESQIQQPKAELTEGQAPETVQPGAAVAGAKQAAGQNSDDSGEFENLSQDLAGEWKTTGDSAKTENTKSSDELLTMQSADQLKPKAEETIQIKVAEPFRELSQNAVKDLADKISQQVQAGKQELQIQLNPENLGKISIKIAMLDSGVKVVMSCENQKTLSMLTDRATGIGRIVEQNLDAPVAIEIKEDGYWNQQKDAADQQARQQNRQNQQEKEKPENADDFLQQLRLGLVS